MNADFKVMIAIAAGFVMLVLAARAESAVIFFGIVFVVFLAIGIALYKGHKSTSRSTDQPRDD